jgi:2-polyprenyl-3-methyl-5-hydroxy-6-metoxy-1,4-benzoquinol methylase
MYNPDWVRSRYNSIGGKEHTRLTKNPTGIVNFEMHKLYLTKYLQPGMTVLEIGAGPGIFTEVLHRIGCKISVRDISPTQIDENKKNAKALGFESSIIDWGVTDICDLKEFPDQSFDAVIAYGGPLSYVFDNIHLALQEMKRVMNRDGRIFLSVMSLWGTIASGIEGVMSFPIEANRKVIKSGDLTEDNLPGHTHFCRMYKSSDLKKILTENGFSSIQLASSNALPLNQKTFTSTIINNQKKWNEFLEIETEACQSDGCLDMGTHLIAIAKAD